MIIQYFHCLRLFRYFMKVQGDVFTPFSIKFNQAASNSETRTNISAEKVTLLLYHLQRVAVILASSTAVTIPQAKLYGALGHVLRIFQLGFWTEITPMTDEVFVVFFFAILTLQLNPNSTFYIGQTS